MDVNYRSWTVATMAANFSGCISEWFAVKYRGWTSRSGDGCDHQPLDRCGDGCELSRLTSRSIDAIGANSIGWTSKCGIYCELPNNNAANYRGWTSVGLAVSAATATTFSS